MTERTLHTGLALGLIAMAGITLGLLVFVSAPYGRHARGGWGPLVPRRVAWIAMESPAVLGFFAVYAASAHRAALVPLLLLLVWQTHYVHRAFIYPFRSRAGAPWPASLVALGFGFQCVNAYLNARAIAHFGDYPPAWLTDPRFGVGLGVFAAGLALNLWSDAQLRRLRRPGTEDGYALPRGGAFELVSCPNYLGEILEWCGWALATWSLAGLAFAAYTIGNLGPRALSHHRWYRSRFPDYPPRRRALVPFLL